MNESSQRESRSCTITLSDLLTAERPRTSNPDLREAEAHWQFRPRQSSGRRSLQENEQ